MKLLVVVAAPRVSNVSLDACTVEWNSLRPMGSDSIVYCLQLQHSHGADHEYKTVSLYFLSRTVFVLSGLVFVQVHSIHHVTACFGCSSPVTAGKKFHVHVADLQ